LTAVVEVGLVREGWTQIPKAIDIYVGQDVGLACASSHGRSGLQHGLPQAPQLYLEVLSGLRLQRAVPSDLREVLGTAKFKEPGGARLTRQERGCLALWRTQMN
jgi:hypothetical protein